MREMAMLNKASEHQNVTSHLAIHHQAMTKSNKPSIHQIVTNHSHKPTSLMQPITNLYAIKLIR